jgi:hypothetical protein
MANIPPTVVKRLSSSVPKFQKVLKRAKENDINEADTVTIITDILEQMFGFDKYSEITREYAIKGTYCDLAIKNDSGVEYLIEVKAIGLNLKDNHLNQAVGYASKEGVKWVVLTNGVDWQIHRVMLDKKVSSEKLFEFDLTSINIRKKENQDLLFLLCKRGVEKDLIDSYYEHRKSVNGYILGALLLTEPVLNVLKRELKRFKKGVKVDIDELKTIVEHNVIKREVVESGTGIEASKQIMRWTKRRQKDAKIARQADAKLSPLHGNLPKTD